MADRHLDMDLDDGGEKVKPPWECMRLPSALFARSSPPRTEKDGGAGPQNL